MPHYILIAILILLNTNLGFSQYEKRKIGVDKLALEKIARQKTNTINQDVALTPTQYTKIKKIYSIEVAKIDSLKFLSFDFYEDPMQSRMVILEIKHNSELRIVKILSIQQQKVLIQKKEQKRKKAFEMLEIQNIKHEAKHR